jgi:hypothetical protein
LTVCFIYVSLIIAMSDNDQNKKAPTKPAPKDYTSELPMFDLATIIEFVTGIHEKALETASMIDVAKAFGYSATSSTPFYRRILAARHFGLISSQGPELTKQALDYLKPDAEDAKSRALNNCIMGIPAFAELVQSHQGKRINLDIVANGFMRKFPLTKAGAALCARVFVSSVRTAGFLTQDQTIGTITPITPDGDSGDQPPPTVPPVKPGGQTPPALPGTHTYELPLANQRKVTINAPIDITENEISRLKAWAEVTLLVEWHEKAAKFDVVQ